MGRQADTSQSGINRESAGPDWLYDGNIEARTARANLVGFFRVMMRIDRKAECERQQPTERQKWRPPFYMPA